jgi:hypothetical protein
MKKYDSTQDTMLHIRTVQALLFGIIGLLNDRCERHDESKLQSPEKEAFDEFTPHLRGLTYGSDEYRACLEAMKPALDHHYALNTHHPEHYANGVNDMDLLDVLEMLSDWKAATERHADGSILDSLKINRQRFGLSEQLYKIMLNTVLNLQWDKPKDVEGR